MRYNPNITNVVLKSVVLKIAVVYPQIVYAINCRCSY